MINAYHIIHNDFYVIRVSYNYYAYGYDFI